MLRALFGGKKKTGKSVNDVRGRSAQESKSQGPLDDRIKARRSRNLRLVEAKAAFAAAERVPKPDIAGAISLAQKAAAGTSLRACRAEIDRALRLKGSQRVIGETLSHPLRQYLALAVIRGLLEDGEAHSAGGPSKGPGLLKTQQKPRKP